jgi:hypothetical protein
MMVTVAECESPPDVPATLTVYVPAELLLLGEIVSDEDAWAPDASATLVGLNDSPKPVGGGVAVSAKLPVKPLRLVIVRVTEPEDPARMLIEEGLDARRKSGGKTTITEIATK